MSAAAPRRPGFFSVPLAAQGPVPIAPAVQEQHSSVPLGIAGTLTFDFTVDTASLLDLAIFADQVATAEVFIRPTTAENFKRLGGAIALIAGSVQNPQPGLRVPCSLLRIIITNTSGVAMVEFWAQAEVKPF